MNYVSWDLRLSKTKEIGFTILSDNEYCLYRGQTNEYGMVKKLEENNRKDWLILCQCDYEKWGWDQEHVETCIEIINEIYSKQDEWGFYYV